MTTDLSVTVDLLRHGPLSLGTVPQPEGGRCDLSAALTAQPSTQGSEMLTGILAGWTRRLALAQLTPAQGPAERVALVLSLCGDVVVADTATATEHTVTLFDPEDVAPHIAGLFHSQPNENWRPAQPRSLDPDEVARGRWPAEILPAITAVDYIMEAAFAEVDETSRSQRTVVTAFVTAGTFLTLDARPVKRSLYLRHVDALGFGDLLATILRAPATA